MKRTVLFIAGLLVLSLGFASEGGAQEAEEYSRYDSTSGYGQHLLLDTDCVDLQGLVVRRLSHLDQKNWEVNVQSYETMMILAAVNCALFELRELKRLVGGGIDE